MNEKEKYFIDLSKCSEEQQKDIENLTKVKYHKYYSCLYFNNPNWYGCTSKYAIENRLSELTYPDFIKLFEGGEGETLRQQFESEIKTKGAEFLFESNNQSYIMWLENKINSNQ